MIGSCLACGPSNEGSGTDRGPRALLDEDTSVPSPLSSADAGPTKPTTNTDPFTAKEPLPAALKGYELYAWEEAGALRFTLITGTNRQKTLAEITTNGTQFEDGEWVAISGSGSEQLERLIARVPAGTSVILSDLPGLPALSEALRTAVARVVGR